MAKKVNFYKLIPRRKREWENIDDERVAIFQPRFFNNLAKKIIDPFLKSPTVRVKLDREGTFAWLLCDGHSTITEIAEKFDSHFNCKDGIDRLHTFMSYLEKCEMIEYVNINEIKKGS